jgi:hypothetical protein
MSGAMTHPAAAPFVESDVFDGCRDQSVATLTAHEMVGTIQRKRCRGVIETCFTERDIEGVAAGTILTEGPRMRIGVTGNAA